MLRMSIAIHQFFHRLPDEERGAGLAEYALLLFLISITAIATLGPLGDRIADLFEEITTALGG